MKYRPILFSGPMVLAILEGRKTQTRRIIKLPADWDGDKIFDNYPFGVKYSAGDLVHRLYPKWEVGDRLWVRETWRPKSHSFPIGIPYEYRATDADFVPDDIPWKPSIFMPRSASRITLEVTDVRAERVAEICAADIVQEGLPFRDNTFSTLNDFRDMWKDINGPESWRSNPWVWVITFKPVEP